MKTTNFVNIIIPFFVLILIIELSGCSFSSDIDDRLDTAESIMEEQPDSSLSILNGIRISELRGDRIKARYALLKSIALDKNYIDTTTFDVLQPAIDYYFKHGNADEKLKSYYYQGVIFENSKEYDLAMQSYLTGLDNLDFVSDSLTLARMLIAQGTLYYQQYQIRNLVDNNIKAAEIYGLLNRRPQQLKSYLRALNGEVILGDSIAADSLKNICMSLINDRTSLNTFALRPFLNFFVKFGDSEEITCALNKVLKEGINDDVKMNLARAYSKLGDQKTGLYYLNEVMIAPDNLLDSLTYWSVKTEILENMGKNEAALNAFKNYSRVLEIYHDRLFSNELLFSEKKHEMEIEGMKKIQSRDNAIKWILAGMIVMVCIIGMIYYRYRLHKTGRVIAEKNAEKLRLEAEKLHLETEKLQLETENLHLEISQLENEQERLTALLENRDELSAEMRSIIRDRLEMLNGLLAKEISNDESYARSFHKFVKDIKKDKKRFQESTRKVIEATHPDFMEYLESHGLTDKEINYVCLYSLGLRGKEVGNYLELARHYNISTDVRRKLGLDRNGENLGPFIRKMMESGHLGLHEAEIRIHT